MPKPLHSNDPKPADVQFRDFGVLNDGARSKSATITSITINVLIAFALLFLVKAAVVKPKTKLAELSSPIHEIKPEPPPPPVPKIKLPPPPPPPKLPPVPPPPVPPPPTPPPPVPPPPTPPPPVPTPPQPKPVVAAPPKLQPAPPAPRAVNLMGSAAHVPNNDAHPSAVRLGSPDNPLKPMSGPAVQRVSMGVAGMPGMPGSNTGSGPRAVNVSMGSGSPNGSNLAATSPHPVAGLANGVVGSNGPLTGRVQKFAMNTAPAAVPMTQQPAVQQHVAKSTPTVVYKPEPVYTEEAKSMHLEGNVSVRIRVTADGSVQVLEIVHGLGHGLDEAARQAAQATRFKPALDATGNPVPWEGVVTVKFQMG